MLDILETIFGLGASIHRRTNMKTTKKTSLANKLSESQKSHFMELIMKQAMDKANQKDILDEPLLKMPKKTK